MARFWQTPLVASLGGLVLAATFSVTARAAEFTTTETANEIAQSNALADVWQPASAAEEERFWAYVLQSPLGIAALNQLAIEGFISPTCEKTLYTHSEYGGFQTLLQIACPDAQGVSIARAYGEVRVTFNRFEDNIEDFSIERIYTES